MKTYSLRVIHKVRALERGRGGPANNVLARIKEGERFIFKRTYAIKFFSQVRYKIEIKKWAIRKAKIIHSYFYCTIRKHNLNPPGLFLVFWFDINW